MSKRMRMEDGSLDRRRVAAAIGARLAKKYPYSQYGRVMSLRGTESSLARYGPSWREASADQRASRSADGFIGRGRYVGRGGFFKSLGKWGGRAIGGLLGNKDLGGQIGEGAGSLFEMVKGRGKYIGRGEYEPGLGSNEVMAGSTRTSPKFESVQDESGSVIVSNREYVGDIFAPAASGGFDLQNFPLNPGLEQTFPWLAQTAANYEEYEFIQLVFEFKSAVQDVNSANGQVGTIILCTNYNASQPLFNDKPSMISYYGAVSGKSTDNLTGGIECDPKKLSGTAGKLVRSNPIVSGEDLKTYDHGNFQLATHNIPSGMLNGTLGELYVYYTVKLRKPRFLTGRGLAITRWLMVSNGGETFNDYFGGAQALFGQQNNLAVVYTNPAASQYKVTFPGYYSGVLEIKILVEGSLTYGTWTPPSTTGNVFAVRDIYGSNASVGDSPQWFANPGGASSNCIIVHIRVLCATNATANSITIYGNTTGGTVAQSIMDITEYNSAFNGADGAPVLINSAGSVVKPVF